MPYDTVHPIVLSTKCIVTRLLIAHAHKMTLHGGVQLTQQYLRNKYWVICGKQAIRSKINSCVPCFRQRKATQQQLMGDLPDFRVTPGRPFQKNRSRLRWPSALETIQRSTNQNHRQRLHRRVRMHQDTSSTSRARFQLNVRSVHGSVHQVFEQTGPDT